MDEGKIAIKLENLGEQLDRVERKVDRIDEAIYGNGQNGIKTQVRLNQEFINEAKQKDIIEQVGDNTTFRLDVKKLAFKLLLAAIITGGGTAGIVDVVIKALGGG